MKNIIKRGIKSEKQDIKEIWNRIKKRDFSGNTGLVIKNSVYQFSTTSVAKIGSLIFTIILARLLLPELFGLYSLALSTILIFASLSELGVAPTLIRFVSRELGKNNKKKAKAYTFYLGKIKFILIFISILILIFSAKFISNDFYQKPLFLALIAGALYILFIGIVGFLGAILQSSNYFRGIFHSELILQISKLVLVPLAILFSLKLSISNGYILFYIILMLSFSYLLSALFIKFVSIRKINFLKSEKSNLTSKQLKKTNKFLLIAASLVLSGIFFGYIDKIMLGRFVGAEFIGYYAAAFSLVAALSTFGVFGAVLLPIFSRLNRRRLEQAMKRATRTIFFFSFVLFLITLLLAPIAILVIYGTEYNPSINILRLLSLLLLASPLIGIYTPYFMSKGKPQVVAKLLILSTVINIALNYFLITSLLKYGSLAAVFGAGIATIISQGVYLGGLVLLRKK